MEFSLLPLTLGDPESVWWSSVILERRVHDGVWVRGPCTGLPWCPPAARGPYVQVRKYGSQVRLQLVESTHFAGAATRSEVGVLVALHFSSDSLVVCQCDGFGLTVFGPGAVVFTCG